MLLWVEQLGASVESRCLSLFLIIFLYTFQEAILAPRELNMLNMYINSLGKKLAPNLFVHRNANCVPGNIVDPCSFAVVTWWGIRF